MDGEHSVVLAESELIPYEVQVDPSLIDPLGALSIPIMRKALGKDWQICDVFLAFISIYGDAVSSAIYDAPLIIVKNYFSCGKMFLLSWGREDRRTVMIQVPHVRCDAHIGILDPR